MKKTKLSSYDRATYLFLSIMVPSLILALVGVKKDTPVLETIAVIVVGVTSFIYFSFSYVRYLLGEGQLAFDFKSNDRWKFIVLSVVGKGLQAGLVVMCFAGMGAGIIGISSSTLLPLSLVLYLGAIAFTVGCLYGLVYALVVLSWH